MLTSAEKTNLINNIQYSLGICLPEIQKNMLTIFYKVDDDFGSRVEKSLSSYQSGVGGLFEKIKKTMGLSTDKSHPTASTQEDIHQMMTE